MTNKDIEEFNKQLEEINKDPNYNQYPERGPADLEQRIEDLMKINLSHQNLNADLRKEVRYQTDQAKFYKLKSEQLAKENQELRSMGKNFIDEHRNKGNI